MSVLSSSQRKELERAVGQGRALAEAAARVAVGRLGVKDKAVGAHLSEDERVLRRGLRARARQLGDRLETADVDENPCGLLIAEVAYEQWHRLLFARFLEVNGLLMHPQFEAPVSLAECEELAAGLGEPDGWSVAARFAAEIVPGVFKPLDPCAQVRLAREDLLALERVVTGVATDVFLAEDALGWVYQYWQSQAKQEVNDSGRKIGGADLSPVTQLFTEHYMVRFLLENSLGAWWAGRNPESPLLDEYKYMKRLDDGSPAAGTFAGWPDNASEITVVDPCCGSGHFLVAAFGMLWRMRADAEGLSPSDAQDAVLRENIFGLELDPRCTQIAVFALALEAWKQGGFRRLPTPNLACSGIPAKAPLSEWISLASGDYKIESALSRLHRLFSDADTLGSLIDPVRSAEESGLESVEWGDIAPLLESVMAGEGPEVGVFEEAVTGIARAANLLARRYTLAVTNVPYLSTSKQVEILRSYSSEFHLEAKGDLATTMLDRLRKFTSIGGSFGAVTPDKLLYLGAYRKMRKTLLGNTTWNVLALIGPRGFSTPMFDLGIVIGLWTETRPDRGHLVVGPTVQDEPGWLEKAAALESDAWLSVSQEQQVSHPDQRFSFAKVGNKDLFAIFAESRYGLRTGDAPRVIRRFWEFGSVDRDRYEFQQSSVSSTQNFGGRENVLRWEGGGGPIGELVSSGIASIQGGDAWGRAGVCVTLTGELKSTLYCGQIFDNNVAVIWPKDSDNLPLVWAFCSSSEFNSAIRKIDSSLKVMNQTLLKVPFDVDHWRKVAEEAGPLPQPFSSDATQWLFCGEPAGSEQPIQVAIARLLGFRWPDQEPDAIDELVDDDGIVCLPAIAGERPAADRVREILARSYGEGWSASVLDQLLVLAGGKPGDLDRWLADGFFKGHCKVFQNRPFIWHIWDGRKDGFSALVNYHRLNRATLQRLTYTTLGWWIDRQRADAEKGVSGADLRLVAARELQRKLELILEGEPPFDVYVRWKSVREQSLGWNPDLDDGVRLNVRPFVEAGVFRSKFTVHWKKDRGTNPDGSARHNDVHMTLGEKRAARGDA